MSLLYYLAKVKVFCLGTVWINRLKGCSFSTDKEMKRKGRGTYIEKECSDEDSVSLRAVKWFDTKGVNFLHHLLMHSH